MAHSRSVLSSNRSRILGLGFVTVLLATIVVAVLLSDRSSDPSDITLSDAVVAGDLDAVQELLAGGADPDAPVVQGSTPLMRAAIRDDVAITRALIDAGADVNEHAPEELTAVHMAAAADAVGTLAVLADSGGDARERSANGMNALDHAAASGATRTAAWLVAAGLDVDAPSEVISQGHGYPIDRGSTPLGLAVRNGRLEMVDLLLDAGADVDARSHSGNTALLVAVFTDQPPALVSRLLDAGADRSASATCTERCAADGGDVLWWAIELGRTDLIPLLQPGTTGFPHGPSTDGVGS